MPEPSRFVRVKRRATYALSQTVKKRTPSKVVDRTYAKAHPSEVRKTVEFRAKKTTKSVKKGQRVTEAYAKRFKKLVAKTTIYRTKPTVIIYKKGTKVTEAYAKRYPHLVKTTEYMQIEERQPKWDPILKRQTYGDWKVTSKQKMHFYEKILSVKQISTRSIAELFARNRVYNSIWQNDKGTLRMTVNGMVDGRRVKEVVHLGYLKSVWEHKHNGYSEFKDYLVHKVLEALRRRKLRLSNPKESLERIKNLRSKLGTALDKLDQTPAQFKDGAQNEVKELKKLIRLQKQSEQLNQATIRIEKLVPH